MDAVTKLFAEQNLHVVPASRMNEVAHDERTNAMKDLHCASEMIEETSDLIVEKLKILDLEISRIKESEREAFDVALKQDPQYIQGLKLRFLRADRFQASSAAQRMVKHFDLKRALFNADEELLGRDIKYSDFEKRFPEDLPALTAGFIQFLPERDRAGRAVFFINPIASGTAYYPIASVVSISREHIIPYLNHVLLIYIYHFLHPPVPHKFLAPFNCRKPGGRADERFHCDLVGVWSSCFFGQTRGTCYEILANNLWCAPVLKRNALLFRRFPVEDSL